MTEPKKPSSVAKMLNAMTSLRGWKPWTINGATHKTAGLYVARGVRIYRREERGFEAALTENGTLWPIRRMGCDGAQGAYRAWGAYPDEALAALLALVDEDIAKLQAKREYIIAALTRPAPQDEENT